MITDVNVTFRVDMRNETVSGEGIQVVLKEPWLWTAMTNAGDSIWTATIVLTGNTTYPYSFVNGAQDYWAGEEVIVGDCKDGDNNQRLAQIGSADTTLPAFVFGTCEDLTVNVEQIENGTFNVYPNPASDILYIDMNNQTLNRISIIDVTGRVMENRKVEDNGRISLDVSGLKGGLYMLLLEGDGFKSVARVAINR